MTVNILGADYEIIVKKYEDDEAFERNKICGYCNGHTKTIVVCDMATNKGWEHEDKATCETCQKEVLRHEIVHAFFDESGLQDSSFIYDGSWAKNEEMVDWIAIQGVKIYKAWVEAGAI